MRFCRLHPPDCFSLVIERINYIPAGCLGNKALSFKYFLASVVVNPCFYGSLFYMALLSQYAAYLIEKVVDAFRYLRQRRRLGHGLRHNKPEFLFYRRFVLHLGFFARHGWIRTFFFIHFFTSCFRVTVSIILIKRYVAGLTIL